MFNNEIAVISGRNSKDYGVYLINGNIFDKPKRVVEYISVPGRSGDLTIDKGRWENIDITYTFAAYDNAIERLQNWIAFLNANIGYQTIETSLEPELYRQGVLREISPPQISMTGGGYVDVIFSCRPQKWLRDNPFMNVYNTSIDGYLIYNPTAYDAKPLLRVKGSVANNSSITFYNFLYDKDADASTLLSTGAIALKTTSEMWIDCETGEAYDGATSYNQYVVTSGSGQPDNLPMIAGNVEIIQTPSFPYNAPKINTSVYTKIIQNNIQVAKLYPRWWTL